MKSKSLFILLLSVLFSTPPWASTELPGRSIHEEIPICFGDAEITKFEFAFSGCGCNLTNAIDPYLKRIHVTLPYSMDITNLAPSTIVIPNGATVDPAVSAPQNWTNGPVKYTVTASDGVTQADWYVLVDNPPCSDTNIQWLMIRAGENDYGGYLDTANGIFSSTLPAGTPLNELQISFGLPCGARIEYNGQTITSPSSPLDFTILHDQILRVFDEEGINYRDWHLVINYPDVTPPMVTMMDQSATNCGEQIIIHTNESGRVALIHIDYLVDDRIPDEFLIQNGYYTGPMGSTTGVSNPSLPVYISTWPFQEGTYKAVAIDKANNISELSEGSLYISNCNFAVSDLCALDNSMKYWSLTLNDEVYITYEESHPDGNFKFVQNESCGIKIVDRNHVMPDNLGEGIGLTGLKGLIDFSGIQKLLIPTEFNTNMITYIGYEVQPVELDYYQYVSNCLYGNHLYESMLVRITTPVQVYDNVNHDLNWILDFNNNLTCRTTHGQQYDLITSVLNTSLIGNQIPFDQAIYTGIRINQYRGWILGCFSPRKSEDIVIINSPALNIYPSIGTIEDILPGQCGDLNVSIGNEGSGTITIQSAYLNNSMGSSEFQITALPQFPISLNSRQNISIGISFCPTQWGSNSSMLIINYENGQSIEYAITGMTSKALNIPVSQNFNPPHPSASNFGFNFQGWQHPGDNIVNLQNYVSNAWVSYDGSAVLNMRPRKIINGVRQPTWLISPPIQVRGQDPVISWVETSSSNVNPGLHLGSPRNLWISTDGINWSLVDTYNTYNMPDAWIGQGWRFKTYSLAHYIGQVIFWKWDLQVVGNEYTYWCIDNITIDDRINTPVFFTDPSSLDLLAQVGQIVPAQIKVKNSGLSLLRINNITVSGNDFSITVDPQLPIELTGLPGTWAYTDGNSGSELILNVNFSPGAIGIQTGTVIVTYGNNETFEIPLTGEGISCSMATEAFEGENWAPSQNTWWKYTAQSAQWVSINSCHANQNVNYNQSYGWDTYLYVYDDCNGNLIGSNDDMEGNCSYNRAASNVEFYMKEGQTVYFFWPLVFPTAAHAQEGFYFNIEISTPPELEIDFAASQTLIETGQIVNFTDLTMNDPTQWLWEFEGADQTISVDQNPNGITYSTAGMYSVTLTASNAYSNQTLTKELYISAVDPEQEEIVKWTDNFTISGVKLASVSADNGWTFQDNSGSDMNWQVRNYGVDGCFVHEGAMPSSTGATGYLVLPMDEYNCINDITQGKKVDAFAQSPSVDCSELDVVILHFEQRFRVCCERPQMEVQVSIDGGTTWKSYDIFRDRPQNAVIIDPVEIIDLNITEVASRQPDVRFRFYWKGSTHYYWMIDDVSMAGYVFCQDYEVKISGAETLYLGYAPQASTTLSSSISGGVPPYSYLWSTGATTANILVAPTQNTEYLLTVTDATGCQELALFNVNVVDVRCGNKLDKVLVCVNDKNPHTVCVSPSAVPALLAQGNYLGNCRKSGIWEDSESYTELSVNLYPNPSDYLVTMDISGISSQALTIVVKDMLGRIVSYEVVENPLQEMKKVLQLSHSGIYHVIVQAGRETINKQLSIIR